MSCLQQKSSSLLLKTKLLILRFVSDLPNFMLKASFIFGLLSLMKSHFLSFHGHATTIKTKNQFSALCSKANGFALDEPGKQPYGTNHVSICCNQIFYQRAKCQKKLSQDKLLHLDYAKKCQKRVTYCLNGPS